MIHKHDMVMLLVGSGVAMGLAVASLAGPILEADAPPPLPPDVMSLAGVRKLGVRVQPFSPALQEAGFKALRVRQIWIERLLESGFQIVDDPNQPYVLLAVHTGNIKGEGGQRAFGIQFKFFQPLRFERLNRTLNVPTYASGGFGMAGATVLQEQIERSLNARIEVFIALVDKATQFAKVQEQLD